VEEHQVRTERTFPKHDYCEWPKTVPRDAFWTQVRRTVNGREVDEAQIQMIVDQVRGALLLEPGDRLLDIGCGNGALGARIARGVEFYLGVDHSEYLVEVGEEFFGEPGAVEFCVDDAVGFLEKDRNLDRFTKALCYGAISFLDRKHAVRLLELVFQRCPGARRLFIGNVPNRHRAGEFFAARGEELPDLDQHESQFGVWWFPEELSEVAERFGWAPKVLFMPDAFYGSSYRFDLLLTRQVDRRAQPTVG
jgi:SAM-dependent methyltransferase